MKKTSLAVFLLAPVLWAAACNTTPTGGGTDLAGRTPVQHRPTATSCAMTRAPGPGNVAAGTCKQDSDCMDSSMGQNGRCVFSRIGGSCSYDTCFDDSTCMGKVCLCRPAGQATATPEANHCLAEGNCRTDSDCGAGKACSPSFGSCGAYLGVVSYYCHTPLDTCVDDADCTGTDGGLPGPGYCMFSPQGGMWLCSYGQCVG
jgi:predicted small secreted protein